MQLGFQATGTKVDVIKSIGDQAKDDVAKLQSNCASHQVPVFGPEGLKIDPVTKLAIHTPKPIKETTANDLVASALAFVTEHLAHCKDTDEVSVNFGITVNRPNPE